MSQPLDLHAKLKWIKGRIKNWAKNIREQGSNRKNELSVLINQVEEKMDSCAANDVDTANRLSWLQEKEVLVKNEELDVIQKTRNKWLIDGDENTRYFHGVLKRKRRKQLVNGLHVEGNWVTCPLTVKSEFVKFFKSKFQAAPQQLHQLDMKEPNIRLNDLDNEGLQRQVTEEEIRGAVWECGSQKSPGPDGFSFLFLKTYWSMMKSDVVHAVTEIFQKCVIPKGVNSSFFTLIPKISNPVLIKDFRPISLIGLQYKIVAKVLANRLRYVIDKLVSPEQSAFISGRQILDGPLMLSEIIAWYKQKKKPMLIFKVDFEKAYDTVSWEFLDKMMGILGFGMCWRNWIRMCLSSSRAAVLVNGSPTNEFPIRRGLRQGDPLSPFLFILVMEGLNLALKKAVSLRLIRGVEVGETSWKMSHFFFADDVIIMSDWGANDLSNILKVLHDFYLVSGLQVNVTKSNIYGVGVIHDEVVSLAEISGCTAAQLPFMYLGIPIGLNMKRLTSWNSLTSRFKIRLSTWNAKLLSIGGRLTLLKSVLGSLGIYYMSLYKAPEGILNEIEAMRANFFWGSDPHSRKIAWVQWKAVLSAKEKGGLNVGGVKAFNLALLQKWRWRFANEKNSLWVQLLKAIHGEFAGLDGAKCVTNGAWSSIVDTYSSLDQTGWIPWGTLQRKVGDGRAVNFWKDTWVNSAPLATRYNRLYRLDKEGSCSLADRWVNGTWRWDWCREDIGGRNRDLLVTLEAELGNINLSNEEDTWRWCLAQDGVFSVKVTRLHLDGCILPSLPIATTWYKTLPGKLNIFLWRLLLDRLATRFNLSMKGIDVENVTCPLCEQAVETDYHLMFTCSELRDIWQKLNRWTGIDMPSIGSTTEWFNWIENWPGSETTKTKLLVINVACMWLIWRIRNGCVFGAQDVKKRDLFDFIQLYSFSWLKYRGKMLSSWNNWLSCPM